jgi:hypothetical protein
MESSLLEDEFEDLGSAGGSTGARLVRDKATGSRYVLKTATTDERKAQLVEESTADRLYREAKVPVPETRLYTRSDGTKLKLSKFIEGGETLQSLRRRVGESSPEYKQVLSKIQEGFHVDAWLANWDVVGLDYDNILISKGVPYRIDNGGALRFRAQGQRKPPFSQKTVPELWTMRNKPLVVGGMTNRTAVSVFGDLDAFELAERIAETDFATLIAKNVEDSELARSLKTRARHMLTYANRGAHYKHHQIRADYFDDLGYEMHLLDEAGVLDKLPKELKRGPQDAVMMVDENGDLFDHLRSTDPDKNAQMAWAQYMAARMGVQWTTDAVRQRQVMAFQAWSTRWCRAQAKSSWSHQAVAFKKWLVEKKFVPTRGAGFDYSDSVRYADWKVLALDMPKDAFDTKNLSEDEMNSVLVSQQAFTQAFLERTKGTFTDQTRKTLRLYRTETDEAMEAMLTSSPVPGKNLPTLSPGDVCVKPLKGVCESHSPNRAVNVYGDYVTEQAVPFCMVNGHYAFGRAEGPGDTVLTAMYAGNGENEVTATTDALPFAFRGNLKSRGFDSAQLYQGDSNTASWNCPTTHLLSEEVDRRAAAEIDRLTR